MEGPLAGSGQDKAWPDKLTLYRSMDTCTWTEMCSSKGCFQFPTPSLYCHSYAGWEWIALSWNEVVIEFLSYIGRSPSPMLFTPCPFRPSIRPPRHQRIVHSLPYTTARLHSPFSTFSVLSFMNSMIPFSFPASIPSNPIDQTHNNNSMRCDWLSTLVLLKCRLSLSSIVHSQTKKKQSI